MNSFDTYDAKILADHFLYSFFDKKFLLEDKNDNLYDVLNIPKSVFKTIEKEVEEEEYFRLIYFYIEIIKSNLYDLDFDVDFLWDEDIKTFDNLFLETDIQSDQIKDAEVIIEDLKKGVYLDHYLLVSDGSLKELKKYCKKIKQEKKFKKSKQKIRENMKKIKELEEKIKELETETYL